MKHIGAIKPSIAALMDRAHEGNETCRTGTESWIYAGAASHLQAGSPWHCNRSLYRQDNAVGQVFTSLKKHRRIFTRYDNLDVIFNAVIVLALHG